MTDPEPNRSAAYWMEIARGDLAAAWCIAGDPGAPARIAANLAQQAAEKALKALIASSQGEPPRSHDLVRLAQLNTGGVRLRVSTDELRLLTEAHVQGRYPDPIDPTYDQEQANALIAIATNVVSDAAAGLRNG